MVEAARARGIDAFVADAQALDLDGQADRFGQFDAAFSNAALHWMLDPDAVASGSSRCSSPAAASSARWAARAISRPCAAACAPS